MSSIINDEKKEFVSEFVNSSRELLDDVEPQIMALEKSSTAYGEVDPEILNTIFRLFHTLKGTASFVDLQDDNERHPRGRNAARYFPQGKNKPSDRTRGFALQDERLHKKHSRHGRKTA